MWMDRILAARAMLKMSTDKAATPEDNGAESSEIDIQKDIVNGNVLPCCCCCCSCSFI